jgi:hypothetical protein
MSPAGDGKLVLKIKLLTTLTGYGVVILRHGVMADCIQHIDF